MNFSPAVFRSVASHTLLTYIGTSGGGRRRNGRWTYPRRKRRHLKPTLFPPPLRSGRSHPPLRFRIPKPKKIKCGNSTMHCCASKSKDHKQAPISTSSSPKYIATQTQGIQKKHGCTKVAFTIALDEDAIRFTATAKTASPRPLVAVRASQHAQPVVPRRSQLYVEFYLFTFTKCSVTFS